MNADKMLYKFNSDQLLAVQSVPMELPLILGAGT